MKYKFGVIIIVGIVLCAGRPAFCQQQKADFLIVENPVPLTILNRFQQSLTLQEKEKLPAFIPFRIANPDELLGDGVSHSIKCQFLGGTYLLMKDDRGRLVGAERAGEQQIISAALIMGDTVQVVGDLQLYLRQTANASSPGRDKRVALRRSDLLLRLFKTNSGYYVGRLGAMLEFGWVSPLNEKDWRKADRHLQSMLTVLPQELHDRILSRLNEVNRTYHDYFNFFNEQTGRQVSVPLWKVSRTNGALLLKLEGIETALSLSYSSAQLAKEIETILLGSGFRIDYQDVQMMIRR